jgi:hypothetical protein
MFNDDKEQVMGYDPNLLLEDPKVLYPLHDVEHAEVNRSPSCKLLKVNSMIRVDNVKEQYY